MRRRGDRLPRTGSRRCLRATRAGSGWSNCLRSTRRRSSHACLLPLPCADRVALRLSSKIMPARLNIAFFASSLVYAYWNGAATYYRGIVRALADHGHRVTFFEPDAFERQQHRDIDDPVWADVVVYPAASEADVLRVVQRARGADLVVKASGVGVHDALLEEAVLELQGPRTRVVFWDVDAPATLD